MTVLHVPDMSCGHCRASIEAALAPHARDLDVDLAARQIRFDGLEAGVAIACLADIGFEAVVVAA